VIEDLNTVLHASIGVFNARSMCNKTSGILGMMNDNGLGLLCLTETWLRNGDKAKFAEIHDQGYDIFSAPRKGRGGGVAFLFDPKILNPVRNNTIKYSSFEVLECVLKSGDELVRLCVVYRSTQAKQKYEETKVATFMDQFDLYLQSVLEKSGAPIICGDFNFHLEDESNPTTKRFNDLYKEKGFRQWVEHPTHNAGGTLDLVFSLESAVDSIMPNNLEVEPTTGTDSDHYLVKFQIPLSKNSQRVPEVKNVRELQKIDVDKFREDVFCSSLNLSNFEDLALEDSVELLQGVLSDILDKHAPEITKTFSGKRSAFWNSSCQEAVRDRRKAKRRMKKKPQDTRRKEEYHEKSVDAQVIIDRERNAYYKNRLASLKGDSRGTYKVINQLMDKEYGANKLPHGDSLEVAERLKSFFDDKVKKIYSNIEDTCAELDNIVSSQPIDYPNTNKAMLGKFKELTSEEITKIVKDLPNKTSSEDAIPLWLFKRCLPELLPFLHSIVNKSLKEGVFPAKLKVAAVRPGLKKQNLDVDVLKNYRPISNLTYVSKILEKAVHIQLNEYLSSNNMFCNLQSGYRKYHSCETAVTRIHNDVLMMIDKKENVVLLLLDLSAAFDTINHNLLLKKLRSVYGISGKAIQWIESYLSGRTFKVCVNRVSSTECFLEIGVPQGSILGPLLFILYTKDLELIVTKYGFSIHLYADDTQVYFSFDVHSDNPDMSKVKACFQEIKNWMAVNYLKLNEEKTEFLDIGPYISPIKELDLGDTVSIIPTEKAKNLGFVFDHRMSLSSQVNAVSQICYLNQRNLAKIASKLDHDLKVQLVHSNILCFLDYCNAVYSGLSAKDIQKLQKIQNNAVRFIFGLYGKKRLQPLSPYLKKLHFLPVQYRINFKIGLLVFKCLNNMAPKYLQDLIKLRQCKKVSSRLDDDYLLLDFPFRPVSTRTDAAFSYSGPRIWNLLPYKLRCLTELTAFKNGLKTYLFFLAFEGIY